MTIPVDFSWNWSSPKHSIPAYACSGSTHKANGGEHTVSFYTTPGVQMLFTKYACRRVDSEIISQLPKEGNRNKIMSPCE